MFEEKNIKKYLHEVKNIKKSYKLIDIHVHPTEIIFNKLDYYPDINKKGVYSKIKTRYFPPQIEPIKEIENNTIGTTINERLKNKIQLLMLNKLYTHIGPKVIRDHMRLSGIDEVLLLPVAPCDEPVEEQMNLITSMFGNNNKFSLAYSVPNTVNDNNICNILKSAINRYHVKAVKVHPNITGINLTSRKGINRLEAITSACNEHKLPLIIHGGKSPIVINKDTSEYGIIKNLKRIDWNISKETVVIAHAGMFGYGPEELKNEVLPSLKKLLSQYNNIMVDISGLDLKNLPILLNNINQDRIIFGSDSLYTAQWLSIVMLLFALDKLFKNIEEKFIQIVSFNPKKYILKEI